MATKRRYFLTTAIAYANGAPHIGHAYEAIARFMRRDGYDVFFLTGTDEHGQKVQQTAAKEGLSPRELIERTVPRFRAMVERLECSNDAFIRTTEPRHYRASAAVWERVGRASGTLSFQIHRVVLGPRGSVLCRKRDQRRRRRRAARADRRAGRMGGGGELFLPPVRL